MKIWYCILPLLLLSSIRSAGQDPELVDSLENQLKVQISYREKTALLGKLASEYKRTDTVRCKAYLEEINALSKKKNYPGGQGVYFKSFGEMRMAHGLYENARGMLENALAYFLLENDRLNYAHTIVDLGNISLFQADYDDALDKYRQAKQIFEEINDDEGISRCLNNMGIIYKNFGRYEEAIACYTTNIDVYTRLNDQYSITQTYVNLGNVYVMLGIYDLGLDCFKKSLEISRTNGYKQEMAKSLLNSGVIMNKTGNYIQALEYYHDALEISRKINDRRLIGNCLTNIGTNYIPMGEYDLAVRYINEGMAINKELGDQRRISNCYNFLAEAKYFMEAYDESILLDLEAVKLKRKISDPEGLARCFNGLSRSERAVGRMKAALDYADSALIYSRQINAFEQTVEAYHQKMHILAMQGNFSEAYHISQTYKDYSDSLLNEKTTRAVNELEMKYKSRILEEENNSLRLKSLVDSNTLRRQRVGLYAIITIVVLLASILVLVIIFQRKQKTLNAILKNQNQLITRQNQKLDHVNNVKNRILSMITHDLRGKIGNQVMALTLLSNGEFKNDEEKNHIFVKLGNSATSSIELLENLVMWSKIQEESILFSPTYYDFGLQVLEMLEFYRQRTVNKAIRMINHVPTGSMIFADRTMMTAIIRNLAGNAIKYCGREAEIEFKFQVLEDSYRFTVKDQGIGMEQEMIDEINAGASPAIRKGTEGEKGSGIGLSLIREFLRYHHGSISVSAAPDQGAEFTISLLRDEEAEEEKK